jgi:drug/metabolite transporter (DMT)-like permease
MAGVYIIFQSDFDSASGLLMAVGCGFLAGVYAILNKRFTVKHNHLVLTYLEMAGAALSIGIFLPVFAFLIKPEYQLSLVPELLDWFYLLILALVCTVYTISTSIKIMRKLSAYAVSLTLNLEPVYGIILALLIFGESEKMQFGFYLGSAILIASVLGYPIVNRNKRVSV